MTCKKEINGNWQKLALRFKVRLGKIAYSPLVDVIVVVVFLFVCCFFFRLRFSLGTS